MDDGLKVRDGSVPSRGGAVKAAIVLALCLPAVGEVAGGDGAIAEEPRLRLSRQLGSSAQGDAESATPRLRIPLPVGEINTRNIVRAGQVVVRDGVPYLEAPGERYGDAGEAINARATATD